MGWAKPNKSDVTKFKLVLTKSKLNIFDQNLPKLNWNKLNGFSSPNKPNWIHLNGTTNWPTLVHSKYSFHCWSYIIFLAFSLFIFLSLLYEKSLRSGVILGVGCKLITYSRGEGGCEGLSKDFTLITDFTGRGCKARLYK